MIVVDIFIVLFALALLALGIPYIVRRVQLADPKTKVLEAASVQDEQGETNTVKFNLDQLRKCVVCQQMTDPNKDLRASAAWVHPHCYLSRELNKKD